VLGSSALFFCSKNFAEYAKSAKVSLYYSDEKAGIALHFCDMSLEHVCAESPAVIRFENENLKTSHAEDIGTL
jgi:hypothetical protein